MAEQTNVFSSGVSYNSFSSFAVKHQNNIFRYWIYRKVYTPYEIENKYTDESMYEDCFCKLAYIRECIDLPNGDILIGFLAADGDGKEEIGRRNIQYCRLSEIRLELYEGDQEDDE